MNKIIKQTVKVSLVAGALVAALTGCCLWGDKCCEKTCCKKDACACCCAQDPVGGNANMGGHGVTGTARGGMH